MRWGGGRSEVVKNGQEDIPVYVHVLYMMKRLRNTFREL